MMDSTLMFLIGEERSKENIPRTRKFIELPFLRENNEGNLNITYKRWVGDLWSFLYTAFESFLSASPVRQFKIETLQNTQGEKPL